MAASLYDVRNALAGVLETNLDGYEVTWFAPDNPGPESAWVWIDAVEYVGESITGGGYEVDAVLQIQLPRAEPEDAQTATDALMSREGGVVSWFTADPTLGGTVDLCFITGSTLGFAKVGDAVFAIATFAAKILV